MKIKKYIGILSFACVTLLFASCGKFEADVAPMSPIDLGGTPDTYASLNENSVLTIPVKFTTTCDSGIKSASYKIANKRANELILVYSPAMPIPFDGKTVNTTINVPVRNGLISVIISIYDKAGKISYKSVDIKSVVPSDQNVKSLTNVVMSTDPADNQCFFSLYEANPVFGHQVALTKQDRIDFILPNMGGAKPVSCHAYAASSSYYSASQPLLAGFTTLTYTFISSSRSTVTKDAFDAIVKESDLAKCIDTLVVGPAPRGANYNVFNTDRRVGDAFTETAVNKAFVIGWGYRTSATATPTVLLNETFALVMVKSVTKKQNGHYVMTFDVKAPVADQRSSYNMSSISPYDPYPL